MPESDPLKEYAAELERVMQNAVLEAEALQQAAKFDLERAADIRMELQALLNELQNAAQAEAASRIPELRTRIRTEIMQKIINL